MRGFLGTLLTSLVGDIFLTVDLDSSLSFYHLFLAYSRAFFLLFQSSLRGMISRSILQMLNLGNEYVWHSLIAVNSSC